MKACVLHAVGDLRFEEVAAPTPGPGEVLLNVGACGVCGSDIRRVFTTGTYHFPTIPGHEFAGEVAAVGPGVAEGLVGERAAVFPLIPCRECAACVAGAFAQCENYSYLGSRCDGAFAEFVRAPAWNLVMVPDRVSLEEAAMTEPAAAAVHALRQVGVAIGDAVLVFGAGPIGLLLGLWARVWGAGKVLLADVDAKKLDFARTLGFEALFNPGNGDVAGWVREMTGRGADVVVEASGSSVAFGQCMLAVRPLGKVVLMGNPGGEMMLSQEAYWAILRKELTVRGTWNSCYSTIPRNEWELAMDFMASGRLNVKPLITHRIGLEGLWDALVMIRERQEFANKVMYVKAPGD